MTGLFFIRIFITVLMVSSLLSCQNSSSQNDKAVPAALTSSNKISWALVIHGGAGDISKSMSEEKRMKHEDGLREALEVGRKILAEGGTSLDAVEQTVRALENNPEFNAGKGAVMTADETHELDAAIMDGKNLSCGAVTGCTTVKNPISLARLVMQKSPHVFLWGSGAERFADEMKVERVENSYFTTEEQAERIRKKKQQSMTADGSSVYESFALGTVGAVAVDVNGNIAAATSTGGRSGKLHGRIGDSPVIGAGTYASNKTCGVSATGAGEEFIKNTVAHDISALMEYKGLSLQEAAEEVVFKKLKKGDGGIIGVDANGNIVQVFNTTGMYRGSVSEKKGPEVAIWE